MRHRGPISPMQAKFHPITGEEIRPVGYLPNGRAVWPIMGGAPDDADDDDDDDDAGDDDSDDSGAEDKKKKDKSKEPDDDDSEDDDDREALRRRMQAADKRATAAEKRLKAIEDAKKDDLTKAQEDLAEKDKSIETLQSEVHGLRLQNAFLSANKVTWHDPDTALALAQSKKYLDDVVDEDSGEVDKKALKKALERLATEHAYLVKTEKKSDEPDTPSGAPAGGRSDNAKDEKAKKASLQRRFPVLNR